MGGVGRQKGRLMRLPLVLLIYPVKVVCKSLNDFGVFLLIVLVYREPAVSLIMFHIP